MHTKQRTYTYANSLGSRFKTQLRQTNLDADMERLLAILTVKKLQIAVLSPHILKVISNLRNATLKLDITQVAFG
jgi:hypothetical protein